MKVFILLLTAVIAKAQYDTNMVDGKSTMVHLFEWKWTDIADECENFLGPKEFGGVQVSPPQEHPLLTENGESTWWDRYQPASYKIHSRGGTEAEFQDMVARCNAVGVRIYVDAVINHMAAVDSVGCDGSTCGASTYSFPAVPYSSWDFNVPCDYCPNPSGGIDNYNDPVEVRNCNLVGLTDLLLWKEYVVEKITGYLNHLISMGVAGFRIDAVKHMWPDHLKNIVDRLDNLDSGIFGNGKRPFIVQEVIDYGGEAITSGEYCYIGRVTEFKYSRELGGAVLGRNELRWLINFGEGWNFMHRNYALVFVDNHDNQRDDHRYDMGIVTYKESKQYKIATTFMLGYDYGIPRVMSSYQFSNRDQGAPSWSPYFSSDGACDWNSGWVCEHRWREIANMVKFRRVCEGQGVGNWWDNGKNQIAFSRGNKGFIAINGDTYPLRDWLYTGMAEGRYCDVISGDKEGGGCTYNGVEVYVDDSGWAYIEIDNNIDSPIIAFHVESKL